MTKKATLSPITGSPVSQIAAINSALDDINDKLDNTVSRDGSTPNTMEADLDLNNNDILNAGDINAQSLLVNGIRVNPDSSALGVVITPFDFGGVGDGVTNDLAAINAALDYISQNLPDGAGASPMYLDLMGRNWKVSGTVDASGFTFGRNWGIRNGSITGVFSGGAVLDISGSRFGHFENLFIWGGSQFGAKPETGILLCLTDGSGTRDGRSISVCSVHHFSNVNVDGYFTMAAWFVGSAEELTVVGSRFYNREPTGYAGVIDREVSKTVTLSRFTRTSSAASTTVSNYYGCNFQKPFGIAGPCLFTSGGDSQRFYGGYWTSGSGTILEWELRNNQEDYSWTIETQVETTGTENLIEFIASGTNPDATIRNLHINMGNMFTSGFIFKLTGWGSGVLTIEDFSIRIPRFAGSAPVFVASGGNLNLKNADIVVPGGTSFVPTALNGFSGWYKPQDLSVPRYYGEFWSHDKGITSFHGHYKTERQVAIADDGVQTITLSSDNIAAQGKFTFWAVQDYSAEIFYKCQASTARASQIYASANVDLVTNTTLSGTTGTDGKVTIAVNENDITIENRSGAALQARWAFLAS